MAPYSGDPGLYAENRHVSARCGECGAMVNAVDPDKATRDAEPVADEPDSALSS